MQLSVLLGIAEGLLGGGYGSEDGSEPWLGRPLALEFGG